ncbi:MAG TPA: putative pyridoxal-dependent aspartate 1-decarboxylase, partial [Desulfuromonadaceae bacterium]
LTYRYCPRAVQQILAAAPAEQAAAINSLLDQVCQLLQKHQREAGRTFVSRTRLRTARYGEEVTVLRSVLANPLTTDAILTSVLAEQCAIVQQPEIAALLSQVEALCTP